MKLNHDCVRDLLLYIEENATLNSYINLDNLNLEPYSKDDLFYTAVKLNEAEFIKADIEKFMYGAMSIYIYEITWNGHQFLDNIRPKSAWDKTKSVTKSIGGASLNVMADIAVKVITSIINQNLNL